MKNSLFTVVTLWRREMVRFYRQPSRVVGALGSPLIFWLLIGSGVGTSFQSAGTGHMTYLKFFFPGTLLMILLFTAIFSTISLIEDRREGFLQSVLVAPVSRAGIVLGKISGGTTLAFSQGFLFLLLAPLAGIPIDFWMAVRVCIVLLVNAFALTSLGFVIAWRFNSIQGFHAVMNLLLIPLWLLSGALFPSEGAFGWIRAVMMANPLTYGLKALRMTLYPQIFSMQSPSLSVCMILMLTFGAALFVVGTLAASANSGGKD